MKRILLLTTIVIICLIPSCSIDGGNPSNTIDQPTAPTEPDIPLGEPDTPDEEQPSITVRAPQINLKGFYGADRDAAISISKPDDATIYYTTDGTIPSAENGINYNKRETTVIYGLNHISSGVIVPAGCEVKAIAYKNGVYSDVVSLKIPTEIPLNAPTISVRGTTSSDRVVISMYSNDPETYIYYTYDGTDPTPGCSRPYSYSSISYIVNGSHIVSGITVSHGTTVKAIAYNIYTEAVSAITIKYIE